MLTLKCKLESGNCLSQDKQTLEKCYMCHNLEVTDDLVLHTVDKQLPGWSNEISDDKNVEQLTKLAKDKKEELIKFPKVTKLDEDLIDVDGERVVVNIIPNDLEKVILKNRDAQIKDPTKAARFNEGKPQWSYVHFKSLEPMIRVLEFGAIKYAPKNWMKPMDTMKILESMQRHLAALFDGEEVDSETGISHMGHIQCNAMFYNYHKEKEKNDNSRPTE